MPCILFYATDKDLQQVFAFLNKDPEAAFIVGNGPKRWIAKSPLPYHGDATYCIWHVPSAAGGPLSIPRRVDGAVCISSDNRVIHDPWQGWEEEITGANSSQPYFGPGHPGIIWLNARSYSTAAQDWVGMSSFTWVGSDCDREVRPAAEIARPFWKKLRRLVTENNAEIPVFGPWDGDAPPKIPALPNALAKIKNGAGRSEN